MYWGLSCEYSISTCLTCIESSYPHCETRRLALRAAAHCSRLEECSGMTSCQVEGSLGVCMSVRISLQSTTPFSHALTAFLSQQQIVSIMHIVAVRRAGSAASTKPCRTLILEVSISLSLRVQLNCQQGLKSMAQLQPQTPEIHPKHTLPEAAVHCTY